MAVGRCRNAWLVAASNAGAAAGGGSRATCQYGGVALVVKARALAQQGLEIFAADPLAHALRGEAEADLRVTTTVISIDMQWQLALLNHGAGPQRKLAQRGMPGWSETPLPGRRCGGPEPSA